MASSAPVKGTKAVPRSAGVAKRALCCGKTSLRKLASTMSVMPASLSSWGRRFCKVPTCAPSAPLRAGRQLDAELRQGAGSGCPCPPCSGVRIGPDRLGHPLEAHAFGTDRWSGFVDLHIQRAGCRPKTARPLANILTNCKMRLKPCGHQLQRSPVAGVEQLQPRATSSRRAPRRIGGPGGGLAVGSTPPARSGRNQRRKVHPRHPGYLRPVRLTLKPPRWVRWP